MVRSLLLGFIFVLLCGNVAKAQENRLTRADLDFFFSSVYFQNGKWEFKLSPNTNGMLWRIKDGASDITGACESGQVLSVSGTASSFEVKRKDISLVFHAPRQGDRLYRMRLTIKPEENISQNPEEREALIAPALKGVRMMYAKD